MAAAVLRAEPSPAPAPLGGSGPAPGERGELPPAGSRDREPARQEGEARSEPGASGAPDLGGEDGVWEPLLDQRKAPAACGPPSAPLGGGHLCPAPAPLSLVPAAGSSHGAPQGLPSLERTLSQTSSRSLSTPSAPLGGGHLCPASAPLSLVPAAGSSHGAPQELPSLERTLSQTSSRSLSTPSAPLGGGHLCPAPAPLSLVPAAGSSHGAPQGLPSLERTLSQTSSRSLSTPSAPLGGGHLCPASAPLSLVLVAGSSPEPPQGLPSLERTSSQTESCCAPGEAGSAEEECPICTEPYDSGRHTRALLNCSHVLCSDCLHAIMDRAGAADIGRVRCPICRQKTPMLEWEICKLQEELLLLHTQPAPASPLALPMPPPLPTRRPGLCGALEHHFQVRFHTSRMFGCLPCVRYPLCLVSGLGSLQRRCRCCYLLSLAALLAAETLSLLLIFLPIVLLVLLFLILDR